MAIQAFKRDENAIKADNKSNVYSFKTGKTVIRILPPYSDRGVWFRSISEYYFQLGDQKLYLTSPRDNGGRDPIAEHVSKLYKSGDEKLVAQAAQFRPRKRFLVNALILSDPSGGSLKDGVKVVGLPVRVKEELVKYDTDVDEGYGDVTNLETGRNITIEKTGELLNTRYSIRAQIKTSNIFDLAQEQGVNSQLWSLHNLDEAVKPSSFEDLNNVLQRLLAMKNSAQSAPVVFGEVGVPNVQKIPLSTDAITSRQVTNVLGVVSQSTVQVPEVPLPWEDKDGAAV